MIPLAYSFISLASIIYFGYTRRFRVFRFSQLLLILLLPCILMLTLGGFLNGSAVILWGLLSPLGAMLFDKQSNSPRWLIAYIALIVISYILQPWLRFLIICLNLYFLYFLKNLILLYHQVTVQLHLLFVL